MNTLRIPNDIEGNCVHQVAGLIKPEAINLHLQDLADVVLRLPEAHRQSFLCSWMFLLCCLAFVMLCNSCCRRFVSSWLVLSEGRSLGFFPTTLALRGTLSWALSGLAGLEQAQ